ncbi:MAG TPA: type II toxin-antitoxin system VapC family toxin [Ignavibacteria bacterium]|nr:type II toxin-antitoxin system VapC family toxin [Ignavibacteria bacterium]
MLDSSCWIEIFVKGKMGVEFFKMVKQNGINNVLVSTITIFEISKFFLKKLGLQSSITAVDFLKSYKIIEVDDSIAILAAKFNIEYSLPMADSLIYSSSVINNSELITMDSDFRNLPNVKYFPKK